MKQTPESARAMTFWAREASRPAILQSIVRHTDQTAVPATGRPIKTLDIAYFEAVRRDDVEVAFTALPVVEKKREHVFGSREVVTQQPIHRLITQAPAHSISMTTTNEPPEHMQSTFAIPTCPSHRIYFEAPILTRRHPPRTTSITTR